MKSYVIIIITKDFDIFGIIFRFSAGSVLTIFFADTDFRNMIHQLVPTQRSPNFCCNCEFWLIFQRDYMNGKSQTIFHGNKKKSFAIQFSQVGVSKNLKELNQLLTFQLKSINQFWICRLVTLQKQLGWSMRKGTKFGSLMNTHQVFFL